MRNKIEVIWSLESAKRTEEIVNYISENWTDKEVLNFLTDLKSFEEIVSYFPEIYRNLRLKRGIGEQLLTNKLLLYTQLRKI